MIAGKSLSLANPILGSAVSTHGLKTVFSYITFSVGTKIDPGTPHQYVRSNSNGDDVTVTIKDGVLEFSHPQSHPYIGVGDAVVFGSPEVTVYLNKKISTRKWEVKGRVLQKFGSPLNVSTPEVLVRIDKTFSDLRSAIDTDYSGSFAIIGSSDLYALRSSLRIAVYEMTDTITTSVTIDGWTTDEECCVKVFAPSDLKTECNKSQKHSATPGDCYNLVIDGAHPAISLKSPYTIISGIYIDGNSRNDNSGISYDSTDLSRTKILDCLIGNIGYGIWATQVPGDKQIVKGNIIWNAAYSGIGGDHSSLAIYNNTICDCGEYGIVTTLNSGLSDFANNLVQRCSTACFSYINQSDVVRYNIVDDESVDAINGNVQFTTIELKDSSNENFKLYIRSLDAAVRNGTDLSDNTYYGFDRDILNSKIDDSWSIGAHHFVRELRVCVGAHITDNLMTGSPSVTMADAGIMVFSVPQISPYLCAGCVVNLSSGDKALLWEMIDDSTWIVTNVVDPGQSNFSFSGNVTSITSVFETPYIALMQGNSLPAGVPGIVPYMGYATPILSDLKVTVYCSFGGLVTTPSTTVTVDCDETRNITIKTPNGVGVDCNVSRRHNGVYDTSKHQLSAYSDDIFNIACDYFTIDGLQIYGYGAPNAIMVSSGINFTIINNIINKSDDDGIKVASSRESSNSVIANNVIYECECAGIDIFHGNFTKDNSYINIYNNTIICKGQGIYILMKPDAGYTIAAKIVNNLIQGIPEIGVGISEDLKSGPGYRGRNYQIIGFDPTLSSIESCVSEDDSINRYEGYNNKSGVVMHFSDRAIKDYRLSFSDSLFIIDAVDLSSDGDYCIDKDFHGELRGAIGWNVGADNFSVITDKLVNFSVGTYSSNLDDDPDGRTATISDSIITFSGGMISHIIGIGDKVTFHDTDSPSVPLYCYLSEKGNDHKWVIRDNNGNPSSLTLPTITGTIEIDSITRVSSSLFDALDDSGPQDIYTELDVGSKDIAGNYIKLSIWVHSDGADEFAGPHISGWSCSSIYPMVISTPWDTVTQCGHRCRHTGVWSDGRATLAPSSGNGFIIDNQYIHIDGLQISCVYSDYAIKIESGGGNNIINCNIVKNTKNAIYIDDSVTGCVVTTNILYRTTWYFEVGIRANSGTIYNNTIVNPTVCGVYCPTPAISGLSLGNILVVSDDPLFSNCFSISTALMFKSISSDNTAGSSYGCISNVNWQGDNIGINFQNPAAEDYHLRRDDWVASTGTEGMISRDVDMDSCNPLIGYIGADCIADLETIPLYFSASKDDSDLKSGSLVSSILNGVMTFDIPQDDDNMGIGDVVDYGVANKTCYIYRKISTTQWVVRTKFGLMPDDSESDTVNSIKHTITDLSDFKTTIKEIFGSPNISTIFTDLAKAGYQINIPMYKSVDNFTDVLSVYDMVTDPQNYFRFYTPTDTVNECNSRQRHNGWYNESVHASAVVFESIATVYSTIWITQDYTVFEGIIVLPKASINAGAFNHGISTFDTVWAKIYGCIIIDAMIGINITNDVYYDPIEQNYILNNIVVRSNDCGIICGGEDVIFNNTVVDSAATGIWNTPTDILRNNIVQGSAADDYRYNTLIEYCLSEDASAGTNDGCQINATALFLDPANGDYHLSKDDVLMRGTGRQLVHNSYCDFDVDAANSIRGRHWDLGALEFRARSVYYSVGASYDDFKTSSIGSLNFSIQRFDSEDERDSYSIITFGEAQSNNGVGVGCEVISQLRYGDFPNGCLISGKIDQSNWYVTDYLGYPIDTKTGTVYAIRRVYNNLENAIYDLFGRVFSSKDLTYHQVQLNIACYNDGVDTSKALIEYVLSDPDFYLRIYSPYDVDNEVNSSQRHVGKPRTGYCIRPTDLDGASDENLINFAIKVSETPYVEIEGVCAVVDGDFPGYGIWISSCRYFYISHNIVSGCVGDGIHAENVLYRSDNFIINNLIVNCGGDGIFAGSVYASAGSKIYIYNNTVYDCLRGIHFQNTITASFITGVCVNNICQLSKYQDYVNEYPNNGDSLQISYCVSQDDSANIYGGSNNDINRKIDFVNIEDEDFNLAVKRDYQAIDCGLDLSEDSLVSFMDDIMLRGREPGYWDRGAFETVEIIGIGEMEFGPIVIRGTCLATNITPMLDIHLRLAGHFLPDVFNFTSISDINNFLVLNPVYLSYNLTIYVEGGQSFSGTFSFGARIGPRTVTVKTWPAEQHHGISSILYDGYLVDDPSQQSSLTFQNIKIYSNNDDDDTYLIQSTGNTKKIRLVNSIVQCNRNALVSIDGCVVEAVNSTIIYRNANSAEYMYLVDNNSLLNYAHNSMFLSFAPWDLGFQLSNALSNDLIVNCMAYNYSAGNTFQFIGVPTSVINCQPDTDPEIDEFVIESQLFVISDLMVSPFVLVKTSLAINTGDNSLIPSDVDTDIIGNPRIFNFGIVDLGPIEMQIHKLSFGSKDIQSVFQDKIFIDFYTKQCVLASSNLRFNDLYYQFNDNPDYREEFLRESKIVILLKPLSSDFIKQTDKIDRLVNTFEAYYDATAMAVVIKKDANIFGNLFGNIFKEFDEVTSQLSVYVNDTYDKGPSGDKNPVKNVKFGGTSLVLN
jgi:hypothetical protein